MVVYAFSSIIPYIIIKHIVYPNSEWLNNCEFYPTFAYLETSVILRLKF